MHWINGRWVDSARHSKSMNPATGEVIGTYADGGAHEAQQAINAAVRALRETDWKNNRELRSRVLNAMADRFEARADELIRMLGTENGKVAAEATFEVRAAVVSTLRYHAALVLTEFGRVTESRPGSLSLVIRQPVGVAGIIVPWNSPVALIVRSLAPALAAGVTAVVKLPGQTAQVNALIGQVIAETPGLPTGVVNLFTESGSEGARLLVASPDVPVISFTGSTRTGRAIAAAGAPRLKQLGMELGGKTPMVVFDDADLDAALPVIEKGITVFAGQFCMAGSRVLVQRGIADRVRNALAERLAHVKAGPAADPGSDMGPLIDKASVIRVDRMVEEAIADGARVLVRGGPVTEGPLAKGSFYRPTLLEVDDSRMAIVQEEVFGPVLVMQVFGTEAEAVALANDSEYGLAASVWSRDADRPLRVARELQAGTVWINNWALLSDAAEEGGFKQSGQGRLRGLAGLEDFLEYKHIALAPGLVAMK
ncbi:MAG: aldehyde dehydrogenase family protein [Pseudomonadota bacterium]